MRGDEGFFQLGDLELRLLSLFCGFLAHCLELLVELLDLRFEVLYVRLLGKRK